MSRIGKLPIVIPAGVTVTVKDNVVTVKGPKGELSQSINPDLTIEQADGHLTVSRPSDDREHRAQHGLYRALIHNMVVGVSEIGIPCFVMEDGFWVYVAVMVAAIYLPGST